MNPSDLATKGDLDDMRAQIVADLFKRLSQPTSKWVGRREAAEIMGAKNLDTVSRWARDNPQHMRRIGNKLQVRREAIE